jgi:hypothetical protein
MHKYMTSTDKPARVAQSTSPEVYKIHTVITVSVAESAGMASNTYPRLGTAKITECQISILAADVIKSYRVPVLIKPCSQFEEEQGDGAGRPTGSSTCILSIP